MRLPCHMSWKRYDSPLAQYSLNISLNRARTDFGIHLPLLPFWCGTTDQFQGRNRSSIHDTRDESHLLLSYEGFRQDQARLFSVRRDDLSAYQLMYAPLYSLNATDESGGNDRLYNEEELRRSFDSIDAVNFLEEVTVPSTANSSTTIRFTSYHAGHVLGAAMFLIEIAGARILYTGDYSTEEDRHLIPASEPNWGRPPDVMICESTFGVQNHQPREEKEELFVSTVANILKRGGRVLMPVFAVGRAQELLLILEEYWKSRPDLQGYPIYFVGGLASRCMSVYRQYSNSLNSNIQARVARGDNPFDFKKSGFVREIRGLGKKDRFDDSKPCVVMASPGMLQSGPSRELLEKWAPDPKNGLMLCGYSVEGTLARDMQNEPRDFEALISKKRIVRRMTVHYISFAAHVDFAGNSQFIDYCKPTHLILCHGSRDNMFRLRDALKNKYKEKQQDVQIYTPSNVRDRIKIQLTTTRIAKVSALSAAS